MDFVYEENRVIVLAKVRKQSFQTLFKITSILGSREQRPQIQRVDDGFFQCFGHFAIHNHLGESFGDGGFTHSGLAY